MKSVRERWAALVASMTLEEMRVVVMVLKHMRQPRRNLRRRMLTSRARVR